MNTELDKIHILVVDDQEDLALGLKDMLELHNSEYVVKTAGDAQQALAVAASDMPALAILDIRLGQQNGLDLLGRLKKEYPHIICIMLTGYRDAEYAARAVVEGANDYLYKPVNDVQFLTLIDDYVDQSVSLSRSTRFLDALKLANENISILFDATGVVVDFNDRLSSYAGKNSEDVKGHKIWSLELFNGNEETLQSLFSQAKRNGNAKHY
ncbi:MAG: response regulator, partial [Gammaproteobacteria bacterium]|nr:response regulator [Gammaproteobacteria bacterium]